MLYVCVCMYCWCRMMTDRQTALHADCRFGNLSLATRSIIHDDFIVVDFLYRFCNVSLRRSCILLGVYEKEK